MSNLNLSKHAKVRQQQRAINPIMMFCLNCYGEDASSGKTAFLTTRRNRKEKQKLIKDLKHALEYFESGKDPFAVLATDNTVITCGHHLAGKEIKHRRKERNKHIRH